MCSIKYVFSQITSFLDRSKFNRLVAKYNGDSYVKSFTCWNQLLVLMFGQLCQRKSLRDLSMAIGAQNGRSAKFVVASTSYPERVFDYGEGNPIVISHSEVKLYDRLKTDYSDIVYGDYAGINPIRQDLVVMARGWIPRIDIPLIYKTKVYWKRRPKGTTEYKGTYVNVAEETVSDAEFPTALRGKWGLNEIVKCADGEVTSCAPNFWISVRMFNHIYTQLIRIEKESK